MNKTIVIKLGGTILAQEEQLKQIFTLLNSYQQKSGNRLVIVHGGGVFVDSLLSKLGFQTKKINGLRVTPDEQIDFVVGALAGSANKKLQACAIASGVKSFGMTVTDFDLLKVHRLDKSLGWVGMARPHQSQILTSLMDLGLMPLISSIGISPQGELLNINADDAAVAVAQALSARLLLVCDVAGVVGDDKQLISALTKQEASELIAQKVITDGMVVKVNSALKAAEMTQQPVDIVSWNCLEKLDLALQGKPQGTRFLP